MSFLNKYKFHYHNKQLEVLFKSEDNLKLLSYLEKLSDKKKFFMTFPLNMSIMQFTV